ncbi:auxin response factor 18-like isoform X2 [Magnolia sinica]|uniref:auxin response factor 18-like isoform X2 n=1 Tax=Magnolia sinica TaxID=86752 RepID=UPI002658D4DA|nr:auxin response factor 18-like isoform X2 [Magnolia sinica]
MITFGESPKEPMKEVEKCLDSQLWHACAGGMVQMPPVNSKVYYFPQGQAEHAHGNVDFRNCTRIPPFILCRVAAVKFMADPETDEVYAKIRLVPVRNNEPDYMEDDGVLSGSSGPDVPEKPASFAKTLTQSDANNGGGFSVPRYCAETIFPRLDYSADPPVQTVLAKDVHGEIWKFRHIYRGTPRRHLLTTGWSTFVNHKKLIAGDSIVFLRTENGDLCVGIRRAKRGVGGGPESPSGWNPSAGNCVSPYGGFSVFLREDESKLMRNSSGGNLNSSGGLRGRGRVRPESVIEAATLAANGKPFEVVYYPRASTPEFCVKAAAMRAAMRIQWCSGMRFKMAFETEDSSRISWFMGTISSVQVADPTCWPNSPWRLLQVTWDEPDLLQNVKRVSPWLVELVSNVPAIHLTPFSPPRKKLRLLQHPEFPFDGQFPMPTFSSNPLGPSSPLCCPSDSTPAGIQGARHTQFGIISDLHLSKLQSGLFPASFQRLDHTAPASRISTGLIIGNPTIHDNVSCLLTIGNSSQNTKKSNEGKAPQLVLFGQPILTEQQISLSCSRDTVSPSDGNPDKTVNFSSDGALESSSCERFPWYKDRRTGELGFETGHCKVFMESEDVGRTLDLSVLGSYEELYRRLASMFGIERSEMLNHVLYRDAKGAVKHTGDEPFSEFTKTARRLTILVDSGGDNIGRKHDFNPFLSGYSYQYTSVFDMHTPSSPYQLLRAPKWDFSRCTPAVDISSVGVDQMRF